MKIHANTIDSVKRLVGEIQDFAGPFGNACETLSEPGKPVDGEQVVLDSLLKTAAYFAKVDGEISKDEMNFIAENILAIFCDRKDYSVDRLHNLFKEAVAWSLKQSSMIAPPLVVQLEKYDLWNGTNIACTAKGIVFRLANAICKADGLVS